MDGDGDAAASDVVFPNLNGLRLQSRGMVQPSAKQSKLGAVASMGAPVAEFQRSASAQDTCQRPPFGGGDGTGVQPRRHHPIPQGDKPPIQASNTLEVCIFARFMVPVVDSCVATIPFVATIFALKHSLIHCIPSFRFYSSPSPDKTSNAPSTLLEPFPLSLQPRISSPTDPYSPIGQFEIRIASPILSTIATPQGRP